MIGGLSILRDVKDIVLLAVTKFDGTTSHAVKLGKLVSNGYFRRDVLYVPDFNCTYINICFQTA